MFGQDLYEERGVAVFVAEFDVLERLGGEGLDSGRQVGHLIEHVILPLVGFVQRREKGEGARGHRHHGDDDRKHEGQPELNRIVQSPFETLHPTPLTF
ncbi:hypothetical protein CDEF62S_01805 [Castellaniella defragrans]